MDRGNRGSGNLCIQGEDVGKRDRGSPMWWDKVGSQRETIPKDSMLIL